MATLRHSNKEEDEVLEEEDDDADLAIMVTVEEDDTDSEEELVATLSPSSPEFEIEMEEPTLLDTLEAKNASGEGSARLNRRIQRKQEREIAEIISKTPPLPLPGQLNPLPLPTLPLDGEPVLPALPPLPELPPLRRQATCPSCKANFVVTDMMRSQIECPICSEKFNL